MFVTIYLITKNIDMYDTKLIGNNDIITLQTNLKVNKFKINSRKINI